MPVNKLKKEYEEAGASSFMINNVYSQWMRGIKREFVSMILAGNVSFFTERWGKPSFHWIDGDRRQNKAWKHNFHGQVIYVFSHSGRGTSYEISCENCLPGSRKAGEIMTDFILQTFMDLGPSTINVMEDSIEDAN